MQMGVCLQGRLRHTRNPTVNSARERRLWTTPRPPTLTAQHWIARRDGTDRPATGLCVPCALRSTQLKRTFKLLLGIATPLAVVLLAVCIRAAQT